MVYRIIIIILLAAVLMLLCWVIRLQRRLDHAEWELDIALRDGKSVPCIYITLTLSTSLMLLIASAVSSPSFSPRSTMV